MVDTMMSDNMSLKLLEVAKRAKREPDARFYSLAYMIDVPALARAYGRMRNNAAAGVDGVSKEMYGRDLQNRLLDLHARLKSHRVALGRGVELLPDPGEHPRD